ncbi:MAG: hypothetical protein ABL874_11530 [Sphingopyxis sp.]
MTDAISSSTANIIGIIGSIFIVVGFAYANMAKAMNALLFNGLNLVGAILLAISLLVNVNLPALMLEVVWAAIATLGIGKALWQRRTRVRTQ